MTDRETVAKALWEKDMSEPWDDPYADPFRKEYLDLADAAIAALRPEAQGVKVKPLVWVYHPLGTMAADNCGNSYIIDTKGKRPRCVRWANGWPPEYETLDEFKAAAQADFEARILSALDRPEAQDGVAEAARVLLDALNEASELDDVVQAAMQKEADHDGTEEWVFVLRAALRALSQGGK